MKFAISKCNKSYKALNIEIQSFLVCFTMSNLSRFRATWLLISEIGPLMLFTFEHYITEMKYTKLLHVLTTRRHTSMSRQADQVNE